MGRIGENTKFTLDRKLFSSDIWFASPWKLKIWIYLIGNANYQSNNYMGISIERGQLIRSYRTIANDCSYKIGYRTKKPSYDTVRRVCEDLMKESRIHLRTVHCGTLITICKYNELQPMLKVRSNQRMQEESVKGARVVVHNKNDKNDKNEKNKTTYSENAKEVLFFLNEKTNKKYSKEDEIIARLKEGKTVDDCKQIIINQLSDAYFIENPKFLNPVTLFRKSHWDNYLNNIPNPLTGKVSDTSIKNIGVLKDWGKEENDEE